MVETGVEIDGSSRKGMGDCPLTVRPEPDFDVSPGTGQEMEVARLGSREELVRFGDLLSD